MLACFDLAVWVRVVLAGGIGGVMCLAAGRPVMAVCVRWGLVSQARPEGPRSHSRKNDTPIGGGLMLLLSVVVSTLIAADLTQSVLLVVMAALAGFGGIGLLDDGLKAKRGGSRGLTGYQKFGVQLAVGAAILGWVTLLEGRGTEVRVPGALLGWDFGLWYPVFALLVIVGTANAVNLTDGLDGLAAGCTIPAGVVFVVLGYAGMAIPHGEFYPAWAQTGELAVYWAGMVGALLAFLRYNLYPAQVFLGDTGALAIGASLGTTAVVTGHEFLLLLLGGVFVAESLSVILQVASYQLRGVRIWRMSPLHHHFELKGMPEALVTARFWIMAAILAGSGLLIMLRGWWVR